MYECEGDVDRAADVRGLTIGWVAATRWLQVRPLGPERCYCPRRRNHGKAIGDLLKSPCKDPKEAV